MAAVLKTVVILLAALVAVQAQSGKKCEVAEGKGDCGIPGKCDQGVREVATHKCGSGHLCCVVNPIITDPVPNSDGSTLTKCQLAEGECITKDQCKPPKGAIENMDTGCKAGDICCVTV